jgi:hypothetical protein
MPIGMDHGGEGSHQRSIEEVSDTISAPYFILDVEMELL